MQTSVSIAILAILPFLGADANAQDWLRTPQNLIQNPKTQRKVTTSVTNKSPSQSIFRKDSTSLLLKKFERSGLQYSYPGFPSMGAVCVDTQEANTIACITRNKSIASHSNAYLLINNNQKVMIIVHEPRGEPCSTTPLISALYKNGIQAKAKNFPGDGWDTTFRQIVSDYHDIMSCKGTNDDYKFVEDAFAFDMNRSIPMPWNGALVRLN